MRGQEIRNELQGEMTGQHPFVRWWRVENDFADYDLLEHFRATLGDSDEVGGFELLTVDQMWAELERVCGDRVRHYHMTRSGEIVEWTHGGTTEVRPFTPETLLAIYDDETGGNPLC